MSNTTLATKILALDRLDWQERNQIDALLSGNPEVGKTPVFYSYTLEYGSDGCWDRTEHGVTTLALWVNGRYMDKHPGNRSYNFHITKIG